MKHKNILDIPVSTKSKVDILEDIKKYLLSPKGFFHVVSLNPENIISAQNDNEFKLVITTAQITIVDGVGVVLAGRLLSIPLGERVTGVDLMEELINVADRMRLTVMLIGADENLADELAKCYQSVYGQVTFIGLQGIKNIKNPTSDEERKIFSIVTARRPHILFVAFGSPEQEKWIYRNRASLQGVVCMGVGGAFDYLSGKITRPPKILRTIGLEWLWRLLRQPWRWRRQLRLIQFIWLVLKQWLHS